MLLLVTIVWGSSFALAKESGAAINRAADAHALGPILVLAIRFAIGAGCVWLLAILVEARRRRHEDPNRAARPVPAATAGAATTFSSDSPRLGGARTSIAHWSGQDCRRGAAIGAYLAVGTTLQHLALDRTSEAATAFLTSLTVIFVPLILWIVLRRRPGPAAWVGVAIAVPGVWLMSGAAGGTFGLGVGEWLGIGCAVLFAWHLLAVGRYAGELGALRACLAQFVMVAIVCGCLSLALILRGATFDPNVLLGRSVSLNVALLVAGPTLVSFGLMAAYQPRVPPVRAALIYLLEPLFAAAFAWAWTGRAMTRGEMLGGALILAANAVVELWPKRRMRESE